MTTAQLCLCSSMVILAVEMSLDRSMITQGICKIRVKGGMIGTGENGHEMGGILTILTHIWTILTILTLCKWIGPITRKLTLRLGMRTGSTGVRG